MSHDYEVIIAGGGVVGLTLACLLASAQVRVAVIEPRAPRIAESKWPLRVSAITPRTRAVFERAKVWHTIANENLSAYEKMFVWDAEGQGKIHFDAATLEEKYLGFIVENTVMQAALWDRLKTLTSATILCPAEVEKIEVEDHTVHVHLKNEEVLSSSLLVGADGAHSTVRGLAGIAMTAWPYEQEAIVCTVHTEHPHARTAWQRFLTTGPLAFLPLADEHHSSIVWSTSPEEATTLMSQSPENFSEKLGVAFDHHLGRVMCVSERLRFPLISRQATCMVKSRVALIGDAVHTFHPLAGQGINMGVEDAAYLAEVILDRREKQRDIGSYASLRRYERGRKGAHVAMISLMEGFVRLFGSRVGPVVSLRNFGLNLTDNLTFLKRACMRYVN